MPRRISKSSSSDNHDVISWIMLRYRPIAPKPLGADATSASGDHDTGNLVVGRRTKRKYVRVRGRKSKQCVVRMRNSKGESKTPSHPDNSEVEDASPPEKEVVTLQLLPERSDETATGRGQKVIEADKQSTSKGCNGVDEVKQEEEMAAESMRSVIQTWIIVESVTDKYRGSRVGLGFWDAERMKDLGTDTCPWFVSDGSNRVIWVNEAYKKMVGEEAMPVLVVTEEVAEGWWSFACRVRLVEQREDGQQWNKLTVACDVWRIGFAEFAWKLDVNTALSLSL